MNPLSNRPAVLIIGANGRLGCAAAQAFSDAGWRVFAHVRRTPSPLLPSGAQCVQVPLSDAAGLAAAAAGAVAVVHAVNPEPARWDSEAIPALRCALEVTQRVRAHHFMLPGNVYNFGASMPAQLTEDTAFRPTTRQGEIRVQMEALVAERAARSGFMASVVRAGDFFGAGRGGWMDLAIVKHLGKGTLLYPGPLDSVHAWAYLPDLARALVRLATRAQYAPFSTFHFEGYSLTGAQLLTGLEAAALRLGIAPSSGLRRATMPWAAIRLAGLVVRRWRELARMEYLWRVPHSLDGRRLAGLLGSDWRPTPLPVALDKALANLGMCDTRREYVSAE